MSSKKNNRLVQLLGKSVKIDLQKVLFPAIILYWSLLAAFLTPP